MEKNECFINVTVTNYGFSHNWVLCAYGKSFYLGQDIKFCSRVLNLHPQSIIKSIGTNEIDTGAPGNKLLAEFICKKLNINKKNVMNFEPWHFSSE